VFITPYKGKSAAFRKVKRSYCSKTADDIAFYALQHGRLPLGAATVSDEALARARALLWV
jgi:hypothetical protein